MQLYVKQPVTGNVLTLQAGAGLATNVPYVCAIACSATESKMYMPLTAQWSSATHATYNPTWDGIDTFYLGFGAGAYGFALHELKIFAGEYHSNSKVVEQCARAAAKARLSVTTFLQEKWAAY